MPLKGRITLYNAFIFSRLNYAVELYFNSYPKSHLDKLKVTENKILKILHFKRKSHINDSYKDFDVLKIEDINKFNICCLTHKIIHNTRQPTTSNN